MRESQRVTKFVSSDLEEICAAWGAYRPELSIIKMSIAAKNGEESMSQSAALSIEGIAITVLALNESEGKKVRQRERERMRDVAEANLPSFSLIILKQLKPNSRYFLLYLLNLNVHWS